MITKKEEVEQLIKSIEEYIANFNSKEKQCITSEIKYKIIFDDEAGKFTLETKPQVQEVPEIIKSWVCTETFDEIPDMWGQKIDYLPNNYSSLVTMFESLKLVVKKSYDFFGEAMENAAATVKFKNNFEKIEKCMLSVSEKISGETSLESCIKEKVEEINNGINRLRLYYKVTTACKPKTKKFPTASPSHTMFAHYSQGYRK